MKNKETGEFELLVGNGQIISGFFILALLLAVFFALGFIVARAKYQQEPAMTTASASSPSVETRAPAAAPAAPAAASDTSANPPADSAEKPLTQPEQDTKAAKEADALPPPAAETAQGTYWQVSCTSVQDAAKALQQTIKDMGLPVSFSAAPTCTRILVGPYGDTANLARVKSQLENAGLHVVKHVQ